MSKSIANLFASAAVALCAIGLSPQAIAKQCIWNKGGYVMEVNWYTPDSLRLDSAGQDAGVMRVLHGRQPTKTDVVPVAQGSCTQTDEERTAVVFILGLPSQGHMWRYSQVQLYDARVWVDQGVSRPINAVVRRGPSFQSHLFLVATPSSAQYLDFWGTVSDPQFGPGGSIN